MLAYLKQLEALDSSQTRLTVSSLAVILSWGQIE